jgi:hypothetical protein
MKILDKVDNEGNRIKQFYLPEGLIANSTLGNPMAIACELARILMTTKREIGVKLIADMRRFDELVVFDKNGEQMIVLADDLFDLIN